MKNIYKWLDICHAYRQSDVKVNLNSFTSFIFLIGVKLCIVMMVIMKIEFSDF